MNVRRSIAAAAVALAVPVLSSCGVNFGAQTDQVYNPSVGVDDRSGTVDVLNVVIVSGSEGSGTVVATLVNNDQVEDDTISDVAGAGADAEAEVTLAGETSVPADGLLNLAEDGKIEITGDRVRPGNFVEITFSFDRGAAVSLDVPVVSADNPDYADVQVP